MNEHKKILWQSLLLTILIFATGILINHVLDTVRISIIEDVMITHEIDSEAYRVERFFTETFGGEECEIMISRISDLKEEIRQVGEDLGSYSRFSFFRRKDYDYLKRKYFLLELRFLALIEKINSECGKPYVPILFFYEIDDDASERQGFILQDLNKDNDQLIVLPIDKDYEDEPLVTLLTKNYNVTSAPTLVIDGEAHTGLIYTGVLNATIQKKLKKVDPYAQKIDFMLTLRAAGINMSRFLDQMETISQDQTQDYWARADATLILGRVTNNESKICESLALYDQINASNPEEQALVYETSASLGCGRNREAFLRAAALEWKKVGNTYRAKILQKISEGVRLRIDFDKNAVQANATVISGYRAAESH